MKLTRRIAKIDGRQRLRYATMALGILALAPPVGFVVQLFGTTSMCGAFLHAALGGPGFADTVGRAHTRPGPFLHLAGNHALFWPLDVQPCVPRGRLTEFGSKAVPGVRSQNRLCP